jgi:phosphoribosylglycinamide formyltransferase-1
VRQELDQGGLSLSSKVTKLGVLVSGSGTNLQAIINACERHQLEAEVVVVISDRSDAYALTRAKNHNIPHFFVDRKTCHDEEEFNRRILHLLKKYQVDLVIMAGYMRLLGKEVLDAYPNRVMNIHPALLPSFPGAHGIRDALNYGVKVTGVTIHFANEKFDAGPIILQEAVKVAEDDTEETLAEKIHRIEHNLYPQAIRLFIEGKLKIEGRKVKILKD